MLVGVYFPPSLTPALQNIGILHHKKAEVRILLQQSVYSIFMTKSIFKWLLTGFFVMIIL